MSRLSSPRLRRIAPNAGAHAVLLFASCVIVLPIAFLFLATFKSVQEFFAHPFGWPRSFGLRNYGNAWSEAGLGLAMRNSVIVTLASVLISTVLACFAAYAIGCFRFFGRAGIRLLFIVGLLIPVELVVFPLLILYRDLGLLGTLLPLIGSYTAIALPIAVLLMTNFFETTPRQLREASEIDGATDYQTFFHILMPLVKPAAVTVMILNGVWIWNDFFIALVFQRDPTTATMPLAVLSFSGSYVTDWGLIFAGVFVSAAPVLLAYVFLSQFLVGNLTRGFKQ